MVATIVHSIIIFSHSAVATMPASNRSALAPLIAKGAAQVVRELFRQGFSLQMTTGHGLGTPSFGDVMWTLWDT